ncbi:polypyrimidine tract-binding protein homolog 1 isoform X1 [Corylus avellana]|uniref:polypyrimidine tract-binding protein homolog 1 isoform X1 n=1 Tax=Corylus avellana TaxID=13451 RepID=UPI00286A53C0|nr:polypyrimidine tract-binding protein homolog 1 isoform X1 [Corylus avellana]
MSTSGQPQFRYTQTPSKVLHLRNLPWECTEEELIELCKPFGKIVNTKCNVGANRNQAFVEFADLNQAISMVSYYASSSEPAQVRGKTVYIQYSNRHEIVNNKSPGDIPGNVLLVTIEGVEAGDVSIDVIHLVFSAFGFVHKIATFEKAAGFQALIQFSDSETASAARNALNERSIPRYLLPEHVNSCHLRISYSAHTDLNIKFQSHRSRDYTNPYLPVNPTAIEGIVQPAVGPDGKKKELESNVLLASIENMQYAVTVDVLHTVFSAFGTVQKIAIFEKNGQTQALVQYPDVSTAAAAREALEGHCIYDGGYCKLHLSYSRHTDLNVKAYSDKSRDYTIPDASLLTAQQVSGLPGVPGAWQNPQAGPLYHGNNFTSGGAVSGQYPGGQAAPWDPTMQSGRQQYVSVPGTYPGQNFAASSVPGYATAAGPAGSSPLTPTSQIPSAVTSMGFSPGVPANVRPGGASSPGQLQLGVPPNVRPGGASRPGQHTYYGQ